MTEHQGPGRDRGTTRAGRALRDAGRHTGRRLRPRGAARQAGAEACPSCSTSPQPACCWWTRAVRCTPSPPPRGPPGCSSCSSAERRGPASTVSAPASRLRPGHLAGARALAGSSAAAASGFRSVRTADAAAPETIGSLNLFVADGHLGGGDQRMARLLADVATIGILQERSLHRASIPRRAGAGALDTRIVIEQARGARGVRGVGRTWRSPRSGAMPAPAASGGRRRAARGDERAPPGEVIPRRRAPEAQVDPDGTSAREDAALPLGQRPRAHRSHGRAAPPRPGAGHLAAVVGGSRSRRVRLVVRSSRPRRSRSRTCPRRSAKARRSRSRPAPRP